MSGTDSNHRGLGEAQSEFGGAAITSQPAADERIGLILVHGIGEQKPGDHLEGVVKPLADALQGEGHRITIDTKNTGDTDNTGSADTILWLRTATKGAAGQSPATKLLQIDVREVHWADINEPSSIGKGIRFWLWGLSAWRIPKKQPITAKSYLSTLRPPAFADDTGKGWRFRRVQLPLLLTGWIFMAAAPVIVAIEFIGDKLFKAKLPASLTTIVNYVSAVKLYSQPRRHGKGKLAMATEPPRYAIRRRMVQAIADTALGDYDRWFVLGHSQGTVVAFNGLMANTPSLTAYVEDATLERLHGKGMAGRHRLELDGIEPSVIFSDKTFRPAIPARRQLDQNYINIYRDKLFEKFRGFISYGSPLDKFAAIWPPTVSINIQKAAFPPAAKWLNIFDPTDPVAAKLDAFGDSKTAQHGEFAPTNIAYSASPLLLVSHVRYLTKAGGKPSQLAKAIGQWLIDDTKAFGLEPLPADQVNARRRSAMLQVAAVAILSSIASTAAVSALLNSLGLTSIPLLWYGTYLIGFVLSVLVMWLGSRIGVETTEIDIAETRGNRRLTLAEFKKQERNANRVA